MAELVRRQDQYNVVSNSRAFRLNTINDIQTQDLSSDPFTHPTQLKNYGSSLNSDAISPQRKTVILKQVAHKQSNLSTNLPEVNNKFSDTSHTISKGESQMRKMQSERRRSPSHSRTNSPFRRPSQATRSVKSKRGSTGYCTQPSSPMMSQRMSQQNQAIKGIERSLKDFSTSP